MIICATEIATRWKESSTLLMAFLIELDKRGIMKSKMEAHMNHGFERVWMPA